MITPESDNINKDSPMAPAADLFVCGLCQFIVSPFPMQCSSCNNLYCEECVKKLYSWKCTNHTCKDQTSKPEELHRSVREILEQLHFLCPGCKEDLKYEEAFKHTAVCTKITAEQRVIDSSSLGKIVASNFGGKNVAQQIKPVIGNGPLDSQIFVLDKDSFSVYEFDTVKNSTTKKVVHYSATDNIYSFNKQGNT
jgi:hypothetical protein